MVMSNANANNMQWTPDKNNIQEGYNEIKKLFLEFKTPNNNDEDFLQACAKIGAFLQDTNQVMERLRELNNALEKEIPENRISEETLLDKDKRNQVGVLRKFLEKELHEAGFESSFGKTFAFIDTDVFRETLRNGLMLKDAALGDKSHGEFTHAVQWLLIIWQQNKTHFLGKDFSVVDLFKKLGGENSIYCKSKSDERSIWDVIVDRTGTLGLPSKNSDCRRPENLADLITLNKDQLHLLNLLLSSRQLKRLKPGESNFFFHKNNPDPEKYRKTENPELQVPVNSNFRKK